MTSASFGSSPVMLRPVLFYTPLPASGNHCQSFAVCASYLAIEKLASLARFAPSFATHPIIGTVSMACAPADLLVEKNVSPRSPATGLEPPTDSKYQSLPRLSAFSCQLYRVVLLPPYRLRGS